MRSIIKLLADVLREIEDAPEVTKLPAIAAFNPDTDEKVGAADEVVKKLAYLTLTANLEYIRLRELAYVGMSQPGDHTKEHQLELNSKLYSNVMMRYVREQYNLADACVVGVAQMGDEVVIMRNKPLVSEPLNKKVTYTGKTRRETASGIRSKATVIH